MAADEFTIRGWKIAESCGKPMPECLKVYETIRDELLPSSGSYGASIIATDASKYISSNNAAYLDSALLNCSMLGLSPPPALVELLTRSAFKKLNGEEEPHSKRQAQKPVKDNAHHAACLWILKLMYFCGLGKEEASNKSATVLDMNYPDFQLKSSSLEKMYDKWASQNREPLITSWKKDTQYPEGWTEKEQETFLLMFDYPTPPHLLGERR